MQRRCCCPLTHLPASGLDLLSSMRTKKSKEKFVGAGIFREKSKEVIRINRIHA